MDKARLDKLRFPVGKFKSPETATAEDRAAWIATIAAFPKKVAAITADLAPAMLQLTYRPDGWMIKQVVHHCADSHINSLIRFKLSLTEDAPTIGPYMEDRWAMLADSLDDDISDSLALLQALHNKWVKLLHNMETADFERVFVHPEHGRKFRLDVATAMYAWHCKHHFAHIEQALKYKGVFA